MNKSMAALLLFFLVMGGMGFLFSRWWRERTGKLTLPEVAVSPIPSPISSNLASLLARMRPLQDNEKTLELQSQVEGISGLVRYLEENGNLTFTVFLLPTEEIKENLFLWVKLAGETTAYGRFENGKGGLLVSGELIQPGLPIEFIVAPQAKGERGETWLSGVLW